MKKILLLLIIVSCTFITSCGKKEGSNDFMNPDGIPFEYYLSFESSNETYDLYIIKNPLLFDGDILNEMYLVNYSYDIFEKEESSNWIINYYKDYHYYVNDNSINQEFLNDFYNQVQDTIDQYEESLGISLELYEDGHSLNNEFIIDLKKEFSELYLIDLYIPYRIINKTTYQTYLINIPVKTFLGYRNNNQIELIYDNNKTVVLDYELFISSKNVKENI